MIPTANVRRSLIADLSLIQAVNFIPEADFKLFKKYWPTYVATSYTTAPELPRLQASLPVPPATVSELQAIFRQMVRAEPCGAVISEAGDTENAVSPVTTSPGAETAGRKKNMRRAFGE